MLTDAFELVGLELVFTLLLEQVCAHVVVAIDRCQIYAVACHRGSLCSWKLTPFQSDGKASCSYDGRRLESFFHVSFAHYPEGCHEIESLQFGSLWSDVLPVPWVVLTF